MVGLSYEEDSNESLTGATNKSHTNVAVNAHPQWYRSVSSLCVSWALVPERKAASPWVRLPRSYWRLS